MAKEVVAFEEAEVEVVMEVAEDFTEEEDEEEEVIL